MKRSDEIQLAAPGAGLPLPELWVARALFRVTRWRGNRAVYRERIERERAGIRELLGGCGESEGGRRVLIARLPGLEDSSRNWSVWMTLEHLRIVNVVVAGTISELAAGRVRAAVASTAAVKPADGVGKEVVSAYEESCEAVQASAAGCEDLRTAARYAHPWFGPLDAGGWYAMAGVHLGIHRVQIGKILDGLRRGGG